MIYAIIGHFLATGERLLETLYVRAASKALDGSRVFLGGFDGNGLDVNGDWDCGRNGRLGLSAARKFPS